MNTEHVIRVKTTHDVVYTGTSLDDCKQTMKPSFMDHISKGYPMDSFPLEAITIHSLDESEMDYPDNDDCCSDCGEHFIECRCPGNEPDWGDLSF